MLRWAYSGNNRLEHRQAQRHTCMLHFPPVDDLLATQLAVDSHPWSVKEVLHSHVDMYVLDGQQFSVRHTPISGKLGKIAASLLRCIDRGSFSCSYRGSYPNSYAFFHVYECGGDLAVIFHPHRSVSYGTARSGFNPVREAPISF